MNPDHNITIETGGRHYLLFDGDCGVCTYLSELAEKIDGAKRFIVVPYQSATEEELARFGLSYDMCDRRLYVISRKGRVLGGAFGVNQFLWNHLPWSILVALIYLLPPLLLAEIIGYRLVANNRHRISAWFGFKACLIRDHKQ